APWRERRRWRPARWRKPGFSSAIDPPKSLCADQLAADQHASDFVGSGADVQQLGIAQVPLDRPVGGVARTAERLDRLACNAKRILARQKDRARGVVACRLAPVAGFRHRISISA